MDGLRRNLNLILVLIIPTLSLALALITISDYGINWDEPYHYRRGQAFLHYYLTGGKTYEGLPKYPPLKGTTDTPGFRDSDKLFSEVQKNPSLSDPNFRRSYYQSDPWNGEFFIDMESPSGHPPLNDILAASFNKIFFQTLGAFGDIESYHLFIISVVSLATFFIAIFVWKEFEVIESTLTSLTLVSYPLLLGEQHFNIKDPIEASFFGLTIISTYLGIKKDKLSWLLLGAFFFALALSTKFNIVFSVVILGLWFLITKQKFTKKVGFALIASLPIILGIFILSFPTLWRDIPGGIIQIINFYLKEGYANPQVSNPILWIIYTTPPIVLILSLAGLINIKNLIKNNSFTLLIVIWFLLTISRTILFGASSYGGVRLIMEYIPALSIFSGISAGHIIKNQKTKYKVALVLLIFTGFIPTIIKLINIHPNENVYFNFLIGGLPGAKEKNLNSWGNSYGNAYFQVVTWLNENAEEGSLLTLPINSIVNIPRYKLRPDISLSETYWSGPTHAGEYVVELTHDYPPRNWYALKYLENVMKPVYEVKVGGVAIAKLWKNDESFINSEYKNEETMKVKPIINTNTLTITLPKTKKLMQVSIKFPTKNCKPIETGYVKTTTDGVSWSREPEDIARDQLKQVRLRELTPAFDFYFVAKETSQIIFDVQNSDACLLKATTASAIVLQGH